MGKDFTNDGSALIAVLYREYCRRRKDGASIERAMYFGDDKEIQQSLAPKLQLDDVTHLCWYLAEKGILSAAPGDNQANDVSITDDGIAYMEDRFPRGLEDALSFIGKIVALVPWLA